MQHGKLIDGTISYAPNPILHNGFWYGNPPGEIYAAEGYKPVHYTTPPGEPADGCQWRESWSETEKEIVQGWEQVLVHITEDDALTRYADEVTGAEDEIIN